MKPVEIRDQLVYALRDDLIGPDADDPRDRAHLTEALPAAPSNWYLTGFLAPLVTKPEQLELITDETADEGIDSALDSADDGEPEAPVARRPIFPSSIGLSVLVPAGVRQLTARVTFGLYEPRPVVRVGHEAIEPTDRAPEADGGHDVRGRSVWTRRPYEKTFDIDLNAGPEVPFDLPDSGGVRVKTLIRELPRAERELVKPGTRYVTLFLMNGRTPVDKPEQDRGYIFQTKVELTCEDGFVPRPNLRGGQDGDDIDEKIGDLQYRDSFEYAVGHGVSVWAKPGVVGNGEFVHSATVATCWIPTAEVEKVAAAKVPGVTLEMEALSGLADGPALRAAVGSLVSSYTTWIAGERQTPLDTPSRRDTSRSLLDAAAGVCGRIATGIETLASDPVAFEAFRVANRVMAAQARQRALVAGVPASKPTWRPFQLAFLLMNVAGQVDPGHADREIVDLIFFPTGGGKTEAYLGLAAFTLVLRRLRNPGELSAGVTVLMRYTLRLLTLDQLERAATLICALELERRSDPARLGPRRFSVGLWVGKAATPNRFGTEKDRDETLARNRVIEFSKDPDHNPSPIPLDRCPWCGTTFGQNTFKLKPDRDNPTQLRAECTSPKCPFRWLKDWQDAIPVVAVDDEIYRELPCFLIATVDKFAALPWVGRTGLLLGRNVTHANELGFYGPAGRPPTAKSLATPLLPPDLIIQDELHLISGPLGTMVGLYETAIDHLTTRVVLGKPIRPKIVASTATVRQAQPQIRALFGRSMVDVFPPPGPNRKDSFFARTVPAPPAGRQDDGSDRWANARLYLGLAAPGRSQKVLLMRAYMSLLAATQKAYEQDHQAADPYTTLLGYFNSLRELGGSRRIVEEEVRNRVMRIGSRRRVDESTSLFRERTIDFDCVELTSRESTDRIKEAKARLGVPFDSKIKNRPPVDVALASNMISVGLDIQRLGLMVVCGQPKTTAEYIQATSRVGRDDKRPGLVVTLLNLHKPRDRSHFEHFEYYHETFYRGVEATSVTPFSSRAVDRGLAGVAVALARLGDARLTAPDAARDIGEAKSDLGFVGDVLVARLEQHRRSEPDDEPLDDVKLRLRNRVVTLLDSWSKIAKDDEAALGLAYQPYEDQGSKRPLLHMPLDPDLRTKCNEDERRFVANRSLRDVEGTTDVYVMTLNEARNAEEAV